MGALVALTNSAVRVCEASDAASKLSGKFLPKKTKKKKSKAERKKQNKKKKLLTNTKVSTHRRRGLVWRPWFRLLTGQPV